MVAGELLPLYLGFLAFKKRRSTSIRGVTGVFMIFSFFAVPFSFFISGSSVLYLTGFTDGVFVYLASVLALSALAGGLSPLARRIRRAPAARYSPS